jgi:hypothetical protein
LVDHLAVRLPQIPPPSMKAAGLAPVAMSSRRDAPMPPGTWRPPDHDGARGEGRARRGWVWSRIAVGRAGSGPGRRTTEPPRDHRMSILRSIVAEILDLNLLCFQVEPGLTAGSRTTGIPGCRNVSCRTRTIASRWRSKLGPALRVQPRRGEPRRGEPQSGESRRGPDDHVAADTRFLPGYLPRPLCAASRLRGDSCCQPGRPGRERNTIDRAWSIQSGATTWFHLLGGGRVG